MARCAEYIFLNDKHIKRDVSSPQIYKLLRTQLPNKPLLTKDTKLKMRT